MLMLHISWELTKILKPVTRKCRPGKTININFKKIFKVTK